MSLPSAPIHLAGAEGKREGDRRPCLQLISQCGVSTSLQGRSSLSRMLLHRHTRISAFSAPAELTVTLCALFTLAHGMTVPKVGRACCGRRHCPLARAGSPPGTMGHPPMQPGGGGHSGASELSFLSSGPFSSHLIWLLGFYLASRLVSIPIFISSALN